MESAELAHALRAYGLGEISVAATAEARQLQAIGESDVMVTPLQLAEAYRKLVPRMQPAVREGLRRAVTEGTGQLAGSNRIAIAGKTGTTGRHAWFAGFAPADNPQIVFVVFVPQGSGARDAAPIAKEIVEAWAPANQVTVRLSWIEKPGSNIAPIHLDVEEYVAGVLAGEANVFRSPESLKAMAVAVRTFAVRNRGRHKSEGFDFCDTTHCQDFRQAGINERLRTAARDTAGELLWYRGAPAATYYTKHCGGFRESSERVWPDVVAPYLKAQADGNCGADDWVSDIPREMIATALAKAGLRAPPVIQRISVTERTPAKRASRLEIGSVPVSASSFRFALGRSAGWDRLASDWYAVEPTGGGFRFTGHGHGHGVGLCQRGAARMGEAGKSYREILAFYYPGTVLGVNAQGLRWQTLSGEQVQVQTTQPDQDRSLVATADRLWRDVQGASSVKSAARPSIRVHPTVAEFRDATGEAGWVAAFTRGTTIDVQPLGVLRSQGGVESTVRHELAHVVVEQSATAPVPLWFREGLVLVLDGRRLAAPTPLPAEAELNRAIARPTSAEERRRAYAIARALVDACVRRYGAEAVFTWLTRGVPPELTYASISHAVTNAW
jgi:stage II sporulation protein D